MRPRANNAQFFKHSVSLSRGAECSYLTGLFGSDGFMFYFRMLEILTESEFFRVKYNDILKVTLARMVGLEVQRFCEILIEAMREEIGALVLKEGYLSSPWLIEQMNGLVEKRVKMRQRYDKKQGIIDFADSDSRNEDEMVVTADETSRNKAETVVSENKSIVSADNEGVSSTLLYSTLDISSKGSLKKKEKNNFIRWKNLKLSGLMNPVLETALLFSDWDDQLGDDFKRDPPPDDRLLLLDVIAKVRQQLDAESIVKAKEQAEADEFLTDTNQVSLYYLFDLGKAGERAVARIRDLAGRKNGKNGKGEDGCHEGRDEHKGLF